MENNFGENLKRYRKQNKMSQEELAAKLNISRQAISTYEQNRRTCSVDVLIKAADLFEVSIDELIR